MRGVTIALWMLGCTVAVADPTPAPPPPPARPAAAASRAPVSHDDHASPKVVIDRCEACHGVDASGQVILPTAIGHSPCLSEGCHASDFAGVSATVRKANPAIYARATKFCQGCHAGKDGAPPLPWLKPTANSAVRSFQHETEYHVEMNHYEHTLRADCLSCHIVGNKSFAIVPSAPGHTQCIACHNVQNFPAFTMAKCGGCHDKPGRASSRIKADPLDGVQRGALRVEAEPWADVAISGQEDGYTTPVTISLSAGHHRIVLTKGARKEVIDVTIYPNEVTRIMRSW